MTEEVLSFDIMDIMNMIPHRYPFLLVDRITECVPGKYAKGYKNMTMNEGFFQGHFPNNPIMPGVLQLEAMAQCSVTHGFGISKNTWEKIENAYKDYGIIVFTDPDHAGEEIRRKITEKFPEAKQAFLSREKASEKKTPSGYTDIGIENASPEDIREALEKARAKIAPETNGNTVEPIFKMSDLDVAGLTGGEGSKERREKLGDILGIGYANAKGLLYKLNTLGIEREAFDEAIKRIK